MKRIASLVLGVIIAFSSISVVGVYAKDEVEAQKLTGFIDGTIDLINYSAENKIILNSEENEPDGDFDSCRLIVQADRKPDELNSVGMASGFKDYYIIQFSSESAAEKAYGYYKEQDYVTAVSSDDATVELDAQVDVNSVQTMSETPTRLNSWGAESIGLYDVKDYIANNNISTEEIVVAIVDTGVDLEHEFLQGRIKRTYFNSSGEGEENSEMYYREHGTMVSSVIVDSAPENVKVANYKVAMQTGETTLSSIVAGILQTIVDGVNFVNCSFSIDFINNDEGIAAYNFMNDALKAVYESGIMVFAAASNNTIGLLNFTKPFPAVSEYSFTVTAHEKHTCPCNWAAYGKAVDITAPGEDLCIAVPGNEYAVSSGTSLSSPLAASVAAIILSLNPNMTVEQIEERIKETALPFDEIYRFTKLQGAGRLDAAGACGLRKDVTVEANYPAGKYNHELLVELSASNGNTVYYIMDGTTPTKDNGTIYTEPVRIYGDMFLFKAMAYDEETGLPGEVLSNVYRSSILGDEKDFAIDENGVLLSYTGDILDLIIPETINGITVTDLAADIFKDRIMYGVTLPKTITILTAGFEDNETVSIVEGEGLKEIWQYAFYGTKALFQVDFPNLEYIGDYAFCAARALRVIDFPKVKHISVESFSKSGVVYAYLPEWEISDLNVFYACRLYEVYAPKLKERYLFEPYFGSGIFVDGSFEHVVDFPSMELVFRDDFECNGIQVEFSKLKELQSLPRRRSDLGSLNVFLPSTVEKITIDKEYLDKRETNVVVYGTKGTLGETWAKENGQTFIEITPETAVVTDLPEYYKPYMQELEANVAGFNRQYQWYANTVDSNEGGTAIPGATSKYFDPADYPAAYYYCEVISQDEGYDPILIKTSACENRTNIKAADYSKLDEAINKVPLDLSLYTDESINVLQNLIDSIDRTLPASQQDEVNKLAEDIENAVEALIYQPADYTAYNIAVEKANALDRSLYADLTELDNALAVDIQNKNITQQAEVDEVTATIEAAITALIYKPADYTAYNTAVEKANAIDRSLYVDLTELDNALAVDIQNKNITQQAEVDQATAAIEAAINSLEPVEKCECPFFNWLLMIFNYIYTILKNALYIL